MYYLPQKNNRSEFLRSKQKFWCVVCLDLKKKVVLFLNECILHPYQGDEIRKNFNKPSKFCCLGHQQSFNPTLSGIWNGARYPRGVIMTPPLESVRMKLQRRVRGQIRGSWVCPVHLDYFQFADMCISRVFTWF